MPPRPLRAPRTAPRTAARRRVLRRVRTLTAALLTAVVVLPMATAAAAPATITPGSAIEAFAPYQGQAVCEPVARAGVVLFRDLVLAAYPATGDSGIVRACSVGGTSEHKEGRAWDWRVNTKNPGDVLAVDDLMTWLLAADEHGNAAAMARRLGVMYVIWDSRIWKSYQAAKGWQPYVGASPHTDHVHVSFSWAGALGATSYWTGTVAPVMSRPLPPPTEPVSDTPTATIGEEPVMDARVLTERRRDAKRSLPGPWRRH